MPVAGLSPLLRLDQPEEEQDRSPVDVIVTEDTNTEDVPEFDDNGAILRIKHPGGDLTVSLDGKPIAENKENKPKGWFANLAEYLEDGELSRIADDLIRGIQDDEESRQEWIDERAKGIILMGLKMGRVVRTRHTDGLHH